MTEHRLREILERIGRVSVGIIGDYCLDAYWELDASRPEVSIETGKPTRAVRQQRYAPGGAGNIANNAIALGAASVHAFGVAGNDVFGREMFRTLQGLSIDTTGLLIQLEDFSTPVYAKPYIGDEEQERIDFGRFNVLSEESVQKLLNSLRNTLPHLDVLIINQQLANGVCSTHMIQMLNGIALEFPAKIVVADSRHRAHLIHDMIRKLNAEEALAGNASGSLRARALEIAAATQHPVFITRGEKGILACEDTSLYETPAGKLSGEIDPVGAGDTTVAAIACSLAAGASVVEAAELGNVAASVTVQKLQQTGTATPQEITESFLRNF